MLLRQKVLLLAVAPLLLSAGPLAFILRREAQSLTEREVAEVERVLLTTKKAELKNYVDLARQSIADLERRERDDEPTRRRALEVLRRLDFGRDGYFYVYDLRGLSLMHARQPEIVGRDMWNFTDARGEAIIQRLIAQAKAGGGYVEYMWQRPSEQRISRKLGYVVLLPRWGWMLGSGIYLEDIDRVTADIHQQASRAIRGTMLLVIGIAALGTVLVAGSAMALNASQQRIADAKLRALTWQVVAASEEERTRLSRELHDGVMQLLVSVRYVFESALARVEGDRAKLTGTLADGIARLNQGLAEIRRISHDLRPLSRDGGLAELLRQLGRDHAERTGTEVDVDAVEPESPVSEEASLALFRVAQQAMSNVERHAAARRATIHLVDGGPHATLTIADDGCGFDLASLEQRPRTGIGIANMRERIEALGGRFSLRSGSSGTTVEVRVPHLFAGE